MAGIKQRNDVLYDSDEDNEVEEKKVLSSSDDESNLNNTNLNKRTNLDS